MKRFPLIIALPAAFAALAFAAGCGDSGSVRNDKPKPGTESCSTDQDCAAWDYVCRFNLCVKGTCANNDDCGPDLVCLFGQCDKKTAEGDGDLEKEVELTETDCGEECGAEFEEINSPRKMKIDPAYLDFGAVLKGGSAKKELYIYATGTEDINIFYYIEDYVSDEFKILNPVPDGSFATARPGGIPFVVEVEYTPKAVCPAEGTLMVINSDGDPLKQSVRMVSKCKGTVDLRTDPTDRTINFGDVPVGSCANPLPFKVTNYIPDEGANAVLTVYNVAKAPFNDMNFDLTDQMGGAPPANTLLAPNEDMTIVVHFCPKASGDHDAMMRITHNDSGKEFPFDVALKGKGVIPSIYCAPRNVNFNEVAIGMHDVKNVTCYNKGDAELVISKVELSGSSDFSGQLPQDVVKLKNHTLNPGDELIVPVYYYPTNEGADNADLVFTTNDPKYKDEPLIIPVSGTGKGARLTCYPASPVNFGQRYFNGGDCKPKTITCVNDGADTVAIKSVAMEGDAPASPGICTHECGMGAPELMCMTNPTYADQPINYWPTNENRIELRPNGLTYTIDLLCEPKKIESYVAQIIVVWEDSIGNEHVDLTDVLCEGVDCPAGYYDIDPDEPGCEYKCEFQSDNDQPELQPPFVDQNCDGMDGDMGKAIFVSASTGDDRTNNGKDYKHPVKTIAKGIMLAATSVPKRAVYVEKGTYFEKVTLRNGVSVYGMYDFSGKAPKRDASNLTYLIGVKEIAVEAKNLTDATFLNGFVIQSDSASDDSGSSYVIKAINADGFNLVNCKIMAGNGESGADGAYNGMSGSSGSRGGDGQAAREDDSGLFCQKNGRSVPGAGGPSDCGNGGIGGWSCKTNGDGCTGEMGKPGSGGAMAGSSSYGGPGGNGMPGNPGLRGGDGSGGASSGLVVNQSWIPGNGTPGEPGENGGSGAGGGGGGSISGWWGLTCADWGGTGGGGGGAGCGGSGGDGGMGGGGSFGIFIYGCSPKIHDNEIVTGKGGDGGVGKNGGRGGTGGGGGLGGASTDEGKHGGDGGAGGSGGDGGDGGGGAGGLSVGVFIYGDDSRPNVFNNKWTIGAGGAGGKGGQYGMTGENGKSCEIYDFDEEKCMKQDDYIP